MKPDIETISQTTISFRSKEVTISDGGVKTNFCDRSR